MIIITRIMIRIRPSSDLKQLAAERCEVLIF
jgi:hypothetical protein